jgi:hypothetical protein
LGSFLCDLLLFRSFTKVVSTTKREEQADWGPVNMLYESKTLSGVEDKLDCPEERIDTEGGFEYKKIFSLFKVLAPEYFPIFLHLKTVHASFLTFVFFSI